MPDANESEFLLTYPVYFALELRDGTAVGVHQIEGENERYIPMFTDEDSIRTFMDRKGVAKYAMAKIADKDKLFEFLVGLPDDEQKVAIDPLATDHKSSPALIRVGDLMGQI